MELFLGYLASGFIGVSLGLIGGGGAIITVPLLVYVFNIEPSVATAYSLIIVGTTSMVGGLRNAIHKTVDFKIAILFSIPSLLAIYVTRHYFLPFIPNVIFINESVSLKKDFIIMMLFSAIMIMSSIRMIKKNVVEEAGDETPFSLTKIILQGLMLGVVTGVVGAGGGFLIIPALVLLVKLPMKKAVGTSLIIITINSLAGFVGDIGTGIHLNYLFAGLLSGFAIIGVLLGAYLSKFIDGSKLKKGFGWFALLMAFVIITKEIFF